MNLLYPLSADRSLEVFTELLRQGPVRMERMVSNFAVF